MNWDDPAFKVASDPPRRAQYRRLQCWYRAEVLGLEAGTDGKGRTVGSMLPRAAVQANPSLNFLGDDRLSAIGIARADESHGAYSRDRLMHNMLSSQPMCVNLFGALGLEPAAGAATLRAASALPVAQVQRVQIEVAPDGATALLRDRTAFDAYVEYTDDAGATRFVGIETKYTEPFSNDGGLSDEKRQKYRDLAVQFGAFRSPLDDRLLHPKASQLFRNVLLALAHRQTSGHAGHVMVCALSDDTDATLAVDIARDALLDPDDVLRSMPIGSVIDRAVTKPVLAGWASEFHRRYLDLSPVA